MYERVQSRRRYIKVQDSIKYLFLSAVSHVTSVRPSCVFSVNPKVDVVAGRFQSPQDCSPSQFDNHSN